MTELSIIAKKVGNVHNIPIEIYDNYFDAKFDTGAGVTVISASIFCDNWSDDKAGRLEEFCRQKGCHIEDFKSASGHIIQGYPVVAHNVVVGEEGFSTFYYFLIVNGTRPVALLGDDFIENCDYEHIRHGDILITGFDFIYYDSQKRNLVESDALLEFLDELSTN